MDVVSHNICRNCGSENQAGAILCKSCMVRLDAALLPMPLPLEALAPGSVIADRLVIESPIWLPPDYSPQQLYNAYFAWLKDDPTSRYIIIDQLNETDDIASPPAGGVTPESKLLAGRIKVPVKVYEQFGISMPVDQIIDGKRLFTVFSYLEAQPLISLDQIDEKEIRAIGLRLCEKAAEFHENGLLFNGFEPHNIVVDATRQVRFISFDRARKLGARVADSPIYPTPGFTAPELFDPQAIYDERSDIYSIGAVLQALLTGESAAVAGSFYPVTTVYPDFERVLAKALSKEPRQRFRSIREFSAALMAINLTVVLQAGHFTDVGMLRELNEDSILALNFTQYYESVQTQIGLYIVADGMGGEAAGEVASRVTVRAVAELVTDKLISASLKSTHEERIASTTQTGSLKLSVVEGSEMAATEMLRNAVIYANNEVLAYAKAHPEESGLGATCTVAMIVGDNLTIAHVGDSRCYLLSGDKFKQITEDHSVVQRMINTGNLSRREARVHPYRNVIYRSIGADEEIEIDIIKRKLTSGDVLLLCSDGLNGMLSDDQIRDILLVNLDPNVAAKELVVAANAAGGEDNTSVIVVRLT